MQRASLLRPFADWLRTHEWPSRADTERDIEREIDDEIAFHLEMRERDLVEAGLSESDARRAAEDRFGDVVRVKDKCRKVQLGERIMLQRLHVILLAVLLAAVIGIGWQSISAQSSSRDEIGKMSDEIRRLTSVLQGAGSTGTVGMMLAQPELDRREVAAAHETTPSTEPAFDLERDSARWLTRFEGTTSWAQGLALGEELAALPPAQSLAILQRIYAHIPRTDNRQQLLKAFVFDGAKENACEVLHLAATDRELPVQKWAIQYLKSFAWRDFSEDPADYAAWRAATAGRPMADVLAVSTAEFMARLRTESGAKLQKELAFACRVDLRVLDAHMSESARAAWRSSTLLEAERITSGADDAVKESALELAARVGIDEGFRQRAVEPLLAPGSSAPVELRAAAVGALASAPYAGLTPRLVQVYEAESQAGTGRNEVSSTALTALSNTGDARAMPELIRLLVRNDAPAARRDVGSALETLTGVAVDDGHDGAFWIGWFEKNKQRLPAELRDVQIVEPRHK